jgi:hypothetical protein
MTPSEVMARVLIDNRVDEEAGELLKHAYWPEWLTRTPFLSAWQFLLCIAPKVAGAAGRERKAAALTSEEASLESRLTKIARLGGCAGRLQRTRLANEFPVLRENTGNVAVSGPSPSRKLLKHGRRWSNSLQLEQGIFAPKQGEALPPTAN